MQMEIFHCCSLGSEAYVGNEDIMMGANTLSSPAGVEVEDDVTRRAVLVNI